MKGTVIFSFLIFILILKPSLYSQILTPSHDTYLKFSDFGFTMIILPNGKIMKFDTYPKGLVQSVYIKNKGYCRYGIVQQKMDTSKVNSIFKQLNHILDSVSIVNHLRYSNRKGYFNLLDDRVTHGVAEKLIFMKNRKRIFSWSYFRDNIEQEDNPQDKNAIAFMDTLVALRKSSNWEYWDEKDILNYPLPTEIEKVLVLRVKWDYRKIEEKIYKPKRGKYKIKQRIQRYPSSIDTIVFEGKDLTKIMDYLNSGERYCPFNKEQNKIKVQLDEYYSICLVRKLSFPLWLRHDNENLRLYDFEWSRYDKKLSEFLRENGYLFPTKNNAFASP